MPHFIKTGYWALEKNGYKGWLNLEDIMGGGGSSAVSVTKAEVDALITANGLVPGQTYVISGVDVPLYGGTTVVLQAETTNKLALAGHGIFYNPKYLNSQATPGNGYGVWSNYINLTMSSIVGTFSFGQTVTANNGATATYLTENFLQWVSGDWSLATSIDNGSGGTANVSSVVSPSYSIGDDVIWGGKHWTNTSGNIGSADDKHTLSAADWTVVPFDDVNYNVVADIIHYDYEHDMIIRRKDKWDNDVDGTYAWFLDFSDPNGFDLGNPIKDFQWGNGPEDFNTTTYYYYGVQGNYVKDSYLECINFTGFYVVNNTLTAQSYISDTYTNVNSFGILSNILTIGSYIDTNVLSNFSGISFNSLQLSNILNNTLKSSVITSNNMINSSISSNNLLTNGNIFNNVLNGGNISSNKLDNNSRISRNVLNSSSFINGNDLNNTSYIQFNKLTNSSLNFGSSGTLSGKIIQFISGEYAIASSDISAATIIYGNYSKQIFKNSAGTTRLGYYDASDVFTVVNVNA